MRGRDPGRPAGCALPASLDGVSEPCHRRVGGRGGRWAARRPCRARRPPSRRRGPHTGRDVRDEGRAVRVRLRAGRAPGVLRDLADRVPRAGRQLRDGVTGLELSLRRTVVWYGGVGLLTGRGMRRLGLPPQYFPLILRGIQAIGVRWLCGLLTAAIFPGVVVTIQSAGDMWRLRAPTYV